MNVHVYIDGDNLYFLQRDLLGWRVDFRRMLEHFGSYGEVTSANFYTGAAKKEQTTRLSFLRSLSHIGYRVVTRAAKESMVNGKVTHKVNLDTYIVRDMTLNLDQYDFVVLVTGDADFACMVETLHSRGKQFKVYSADGCIANELRELVGMNFVDIRTLKDELEMKTDE